MRKAPLLAIAELPVHGTAELTRAAGFMGWLRQWLRDHPADKSGEAYYTPVGRVKIFHPADIDRIEAALRGEVKCRSVSGRPAKA